MFSVGLKVSVNLFLAESQGSRSVDARGGQDLSEQLRYRYVRKAGFERLGCHIITCTLCYLYGTMFYT